MTISRIEFELPIDDNGRDAALLGFNVDGEMRWTIEAGRDHDAPMTQVEGLTSEQLNEIVVRFARFQDGKL